MSPSDGSEEEKQHDQAEENLESRKRGRILVTGWSVNPPNTQEPVSRGGPSATHTFLLIREYSPFLARKEAVRR